MPKMTPSTARFAEDSNRYENRFTVKKLKNISKRFLGNPITGKQRLQFFFFFRLIMEDPHCANEFREKFFLEAANAFSKNFFVRLSNKELGDVRFSATLPLLLRHEECKRYSKSLEICNGCDRTSSIPCDCKCDTNLSLNDCRSDGTYCLCLQDCSIGKISYLPNGEIYKHCLKFAERHSDELYEQINETITELSHLNDFFPIFNKIYDNSSRYAVFRNCKCFLFLFPYLTMICNHAEYSLNICTLETRREYFKYLIKKFNLPYDSDRICTLLDDAYRLKRCNADECFGNCTRKENQFACIKELIHVYTDFYEK